MAAASQRPTSRKGGHRGASRLCVVTRPYSGRVPSEWYQRPGRWTLVRPVDAAPEDPGPRGWEGVGMAAQKTPLSAPLRRRVGQWETRAAEWDFIFSCSAFVGPPRARCRRGVVRPLSPSGDGLPFGCTVRCRVGYSVCGMLRVSCGCTDAGGSVATPRGGT